MKHLRYSVSVLLVILAIVRPVAFAQEPKPPKELTTARDEYFRRQDAALQPVKQWYRQQLEQLERSAVQRNDLEAALALRKEKDSIEAASVGTPALTIVKATYGAGERTIDITRQVQMAVSNNKLQITSPWGFSPDPAFGAHKEAKIQYRYSGTEKTATFKQTEPISLP